MASIDTPKFQWHDLPCTPYNGNRIFSIFTPESENKQELTLPPLYVTWADSPPWIRTVERVNPPLQDYVLYMHQKAGNGRLFFYGKALTEKERQTPYRTTYERRMQFWPTVLLKLWFDVITDDAGNESYRDHSKFRDGQTYPTVFQINYYQSDIQWTKERFSRLFPLTETVRWNFSSDQGSFPESLHPRVVFPASTQEPTRRQLFGVGTSGVSIGNDYIEEVYAATPMEDWEKYAVEITKQDTLGQYDYTEVIALPPIDDREATV